MIREEASGISTSKNQLGTNVSLEARVARWFSQYAAGVLTTLTVTAVCLILTPLIYMDSSTHAKLEQQQESYITLLNDAKAAQHSAEQAETRAKAAEEAARASSQKAEETVRHAHKGYEIAATELLSAKQTLKKVEEQKHSTEVALRETTERVDRLMSETTEISQSMKALQGRLDAARDENEALKQKLTKAEAENTALAKEIEKLKRNERGYFHQH